MVRRILSLILLFCIVFHLQSQIPKAPIPNRLVVDYGEVLTSTEENQLTQKLNAYNDSTSNQILILTVASLNQMDAGEFATEVGHQWGIGNDDFDNGIVILVAPNDRKTFIATGYGAEPFVPDAIANRIVDRHLLPAFRANEYFAGLDDATDEIIDRMSGQYKPEETEGIPIKYIILFILILFLFMWISRSKRGGRKTYTDRKVIRYPRPYSSGRGTGYWGEFSKGSGHFGGGSSSSSGGSFGGFGGGSFGGGGAGGSW